MSSSIPMWRTNDNAADKNTGVFRERLNQGGVSIHTIGSVGAMGNQGHRHRFLPVDPVYRDQAHQNRLLPAHPSCVSPLGYNAVDAITHVTLKYNHHHGNKQCGKIIERFMPKCRV